jgi:N-methylhydantoinase A
MTSADPPTKRSREAQLDGRVGVDIGGTFTDVLLDDGARAIALKVPSVPAAPERGVLDGLGERVDVLACARLFLHGTTVGLNALLQRRGAVVGMLVTRGFRDVLELRRGDRGRPYLLSWRPGPPLVPRRRRLPVTERIGGDGTVHQPLDEQDVERALEELRAAAVDVIAVCLLNAYRNPAHELAAERVLRECGWEREIVLSHRVSGEYREFERTSTTVLDALIRPIVGGYLERLERGLRERGFTGSALVTRSGGGALPFAQAAARPIETVMSGPVAGAQGAATLARELELDQALTIDVGGTSADTCLVLDGRPQLMYEGRIGEWPVQVPWVDVRSIGAGGGSIARADDGLLVVGPDSAGAAPGPACYGRGGERATVTDAALLLGMLGEGVLSGGLRLSAERARAVVDELARELSLEPDATARGIITIATASMADAMRVLGAERGIDPRRVTLIAFGGAGPLFGCALADALGVPRLVIPPLAGTFSAWGLLESDVVHASARTQVMQCGAEELSEARRIVAELIDELRERVNGTADVVERSARGLVDVRHRGQEHTLTIPLPESPDVESLERSFGDEYERVFGHRLDGPLELVACRGELRDALAAPAREQRPMGLASPAAPTTATRRAWSFRAAEWLEFELLARDSLAPGNTVAGPAIVTEETATTYLDHGFTARCHERGALIVERDSRDA